MIHLMTFKDVGSQKFPRTDFFKLARQKGNDLLLPKRQKTIGGHRLRFGKNMLGFGELATPPTFWE